MKLTQTLGEKNLGLENCPSIMHCSSSVVTLSLSDGAHKMELSRSRICFYSHVAVSLIRILDCIFRTKCFIASYCMMADK